MCCLTFCLRRKSRCMPCDLECMREFSRRQTTGCVELFSLACYILNTRAYERILPCMYCITMYVMQNAVCNCEIKSILTCLLTYNKSSNKFDSLMLQKLSRPETSCTLLRPLVKPALPTC